MKIIVNKAIFDRNNEWKNERKLSRINYLWT